MNLRVKHLGQLATLAVASIFLSCQDDSSLIGPEDPNPKFKLAYIDIPVSSSVLLMDSVRTSNYDATSDINRLLVGQFEDPKFGKVSAAAFAQFFPSDTIYTQNTPVFDSISLWLRHDYYAYGANGGSTQRVSIHELTEKLKSSFDVKVTQNTGGQQKPHTTTYTRPQFYYSKSNTAYDATVLGSRAYTVDLEQYNQEFNDATPSTTFTKIPLSPAFGKKLFDYAQATSKSDFRTLSIFSEAFKGIAIVPTEGNKVIGFTPADDSTKIMLHYHTTKDTLALNFYLTTSSSGLISYSRITSDRSSGELSSLTNFYQDSEPNGDKRYIQGGTGVVTKIDFSKVLEFADTLSRIAVNSAEILISNVDDPGTYLPPQYLAVKLINDNNRLKKASYAGNSVAVAKDNEDLFAYQGYVNFDRKSNFSSTEIPFDSTYFILNDSGSPFVLSYSSDKKTYSGTAALFFQRLFQKTEGFTRFTKAVLIPYQPPVVTTSNGSNLGGKTFNRVSFNKNDIILRVYYTVPIVNTNP